MSDMTLQKDSFIFVVLLASDFFQLASSILFSFIIQLLSRFTASHARHLLQPLLLSLAAALG